MISMVLSRTSFVISLVCSLSVPANAQSLNGFGLPDRSSQSVSSALPKLSGTRKTPRTAPNSPDARNIISDAFTQKYGFGLGMSMQQIYDQGTWNAVSSIGLVTSGLRPDQPRISLVFNGPGSKGHLASVSVITNFDAPAETVSAPCDADFASLSDIAEKAKLVKEPRAEDGRVRMSNLQAKIDNASDQERPSLLEERDILRGMMDADARDSAMMGALGQLHAAYSAAGLRYIIDQKYGGTVLPHKCATILSLDISN